MTKKETGNYGIDDILDWTLELTSSSLVSSGSTLSLWKIIETLAENAGYASNYSVVNTAHFASIGVLFCALGYLLYDGYFNKGKTTERAVNSALKYFK